MYCDRQFNDTQIRTEMSASFADVLDQEMPDLGRQSLKLTLV